MIAYHPTNPPSPQEPLAMLYMDYTSSPPRASSHCCCWAPFPRAWRPGNGSNGPERRRRSGGDTPGMWAGRGRAEKPRRRGRLEWLRA